MELFSYVDIFATKGIEYLLVIDFLLIFILFWRVLNTPVREAHQGGEVRYGGAAEDQQGAKQVSPFGPQWVWKWEIIRVG